MRSQGRWPTLKNLQELELLQFFVLGIFGRFCMLVDVHGTYTHLKSPVQNKFFKTEEKHLTKQLEFQIGQTTLKFCPI